MSATTRLCSLDELVDGRHSVRGGRSGHLRGAARGSGVRDGDRCTHGDVSLSGGIVDPDECTLECPKHGSEFSLETGEALSLPALKPVPSYASRRRRPVEVELS